MNDEVIKGWKLAREYYQVHGGVPPYPPPHVVEAFKEREAEPAGEVYIPVPEEAPIPKADWTGGMNPSEQVEARKKRSKKAGG